MCRDFNDWSSLRGCIVVVHNACCSNTTGALHHNGKSEHRSNTLITEIRYIYIYIYIMHLKVFVYHLHACTLCA